MDSKDWLEGAKECFDLGIENADIETCRLVIEDVFEKGFTKESLILEQILLNTPLSKFAIVSPYGL